MDSNGSFIKNDESTVHMTLILIILLEHARYE